MRNPGSGGEPRKAGPVIKLMLENKKDAQFSGASFLLFKARG